MKHVAATHGLNDVMTTIIESHGFISMELRSRGAEGYKFGRFEELFGSFSGKIALRGQLLRLKEFITIENF